MRVHNLLFPLVATLGFSHAWAADTLYQRLGGRQGIQPLVSDFVDMVIRDPRIRMNADAKKFLDRANPADLKGLLYQSVCEAASGPCKASATNEALKKVVLAMDLAPSDWQGIDGDFSAALVKFKVAPADQKDLRGLMDRAKAQF